MYLLKQDIPRTLREVNIYRKLFLIFYYTFTITFHCISQFRVVVVLFFPNHLLFIFAFFIRYYGIFHLFSNAAQNYMNFIGYIIKKCIKLKLCTNRLILNWKPQTQFLSSNRRSNTFF